MATLMRLFVPLLAPMLALVVAPPAVIAQEAAPQLSLEHRMLLRCSAAFALVANGQSNGQEDALRYPDLSVRGQEFFVRASAQVMDEAGLDRAQVSAVLSAEAQQMWDNASIDEVMPVCIGLLPTE